MHPQGGDAVFAKVNTDAKAEDGEKKGNWPWQKGSAMAAFFLD